MAPWSRWTIAGQKVQLCRLRALIEGDMETPAAVFAALEPVISRELSVDQDRGVLSGFVSPCLMEGIDGELARETEGRSQVFAAG